MVYLFYVIELLIFNLTVWQLLIMYLIYSIHFHCIIDMFEFKPFIFFLLKYRW